ncbi:hypothetical protein GQ44DRAFT_697305 [Phaeosphaeriaceae sp. PMI808]|nr:hypothetical protein GQ44DRAFT_697305 [Phaeosphaeriaceae sp. PMI808]
MFDVSQRKFSSSSSLVVHHSSPVVIPTLTSLHTPPSDVPVHTSGLPAGTIPDSPAPLRKVLENDPDQFAAVSDLSPERFRTGVATGSLPTPMPGTNLGFTDNDLIGAASKQNLLSEPSNYFDIPVVNQPENNTPVKISRVTSPVVDTAISNDCLVKNTVNGVTSTCPKADDSDQGRSSSGTMHTRSSSIVVETSHHILYYWRANDEAAELQVSLQSPVNERELKNETSPPVDKEHVSYETLREAHSNGKGTNTHHARQVKLMSQTEPYRQAHSTAMNDPVLGDNTWGTQGSLYDGNGYGDATRTNSARSSAQSAPAEVPGEKIDEAINATTSLTQESMAMARDHETLEEVIRAYAAMEEEGASLGMTDNAVEEMVAEIEADVDLANRMADHSLGA